MKVCIGSLGRFHAFDLAQQLERLGYLERLYSAYPRFKIDGLPQEKLATFPWLFLPSILFGRLGFSNVRYYLNRFAIESFDHWMSGNLRFCDVFHCLSSFGLKTFQVAKERYGALTVCGRSASHIQYQSEILAEEYLLWGMPYVPIDPKIIDRELKEYEECDLIFVNSGFAFQSFIKKGVPQQKLRIIPTGVDLSMFRPSPKKDNIFRVIYVGTLSMRKGIPYLLEALRSSNIPGLELWLVGSILPEVKPFLARYEGKFRYLGIIPRKDLYQYYSQASVFVLASIEEGLALVQAQAMACGVPVIATAHTGAEDLFLDGREGFIVPIRDPNAIREKVELLYEQPHLRHAMAEAALQRVQSIGGWNHYGETVAKTYRQGLAARSV